MTRPNRIDLQGFCMLSMFILTVASCAHRTQESAETTAPVDRTVQSGDTPATAPGQTTPTTRGSNLWVPDVAAPRGIEEIVVSGSRLRRDAPISALEARSARGSGAQQSPIRSLLIVPYTKTVSGKAIHTTIRPGEELWIIATPDADVSASRGDDTPGSGAMLASFPATAKHHAQEQVPLPLKRTAVTAEINGYISTVDVRQTFVNPFAEKIEAVYLFPLPEMAAVSEFLMIIGERKIRGILREKAEARAIYQQARAQGYQASLLVQHRPNVFEQNVANIEPGKAIDVNITYFHTLAYQDGWYSFVFPTVVGPRYNPPHAPAPLRAVPEGTLPGADTAIQYLRPDQRSAHDISIDLKVNAGVVIEEFDSSHNIVTHHEMADTASIQLAQETTIPNRDFVFRFRVAGNTLKSDLLASRNEQGQGYFTLMVYPPAVPDEGHRQPMEMVFVLDCSGSMRGRPLEQAKNAVAAALDQLAESDTFQIIRFSDQASQFGEIPMLATESNLAMAHRYLRDLHGAGGTRMIEGIKAALEFPHDASRLRFVTFMTDGYIGNEIEILAAMHERIDASRVFSFGVGSSVNRYLLERMAKLGRGAVAYLGPTGSASKIMTQFFDRISHPALTDVEIDWGSMVVTEMYPARMPDLFSGRPVVVTGKYNGEVGAVSVSGRRGNQDQRFDVSGASAGVSNTYIPKIWARLRIAELNDRQTLEHDPYNELQAAITRTALEYQLMSDYTSFVAVDSSARTVGTYGTTVHQAVPVPAGVRYETTVENH